MDLPQNGKHMRIMPALLIMMVLLVGSGCATHFSYIYSDDDLKTILQERLDAPEQEQMVYPFEANEEMQIFARRITLTAHGTKAKCRRLVEGILNKSQLNVRYSKYQTKTAQALYYEGEGNCLAYTNLFVSLARSIGLRALFADASLLIHDIEEKEGVIVNNGHICAVVYAEPEFIFVDFSSRLLKHMVGYTMINDIEAIAHYYNNLGYEKRTIAQAEQSNKDNREGIEDFELSVKICPDFYRGYNNLGVVYQQIGDLDRAIENYQKALIINPDFSSGYANLGMIYYQRNELERARKFFRKAISFNQDNHFNYYYLGMIALKNNNLDESKKYFQKAIGIKDNFSLAHFYLSKVYRLQGETEKAQKESELSQLSSQQSTTE
ncbi:tetratricopeptide repeat protein [bacterium]|nr:tetratricopeptide repeat protein [bacterium]